MLLPQALWHRLFDPQAAIRPDTVRPQLHVRIGHALPSDPAAAYVAVDRMVKNVEARVAGSAIFGDNLGAALLSARSDALYARVLFLVLGLPGAALAVMLTVAVAYAGADRRRSEQALLRVRGASTVQILQLAALEAAAAAGGGVIFGTTLAISAMHALGNISIVRAMPWLVGAGIAGIVVAGFAVLAPAWAQSPSLRIPTRFLHRTRKTWTSPYSTGTCTRPSSMKWRA